MFIFVIMMCEIVIFEGVWRVIMVVEMIYEMVGLVLIEF